MDSEKQTEEQANWQFKPEDEPQNADNLSEAEPRGIPLPAIPAVEWSASEYIAHEKSAGWYAVFFAGGGLLVVIVFAVTRDYLASLVVLLACAAISVYAGRKPATNRYIVDEKGVQVQEKFRPYSEFRSFSIVEEGGIDSIWLKSLKRFSPPVVMYFSPEDGDKIIDVVANFLPNEEHELDAIDRFSKRLRF